MDCERIQNKGFYPAGPLSWRESEENIISFAQTALAFGYKATFFAVPEAAEQHADIFRGLIRCGHEVGLHLHPDTFRLGINEYLGNLPYNIQYKIIKDARDVFESAMGFLPTSFRSGYFSANQDTFRALEVLGFKGGSSVMPGRHLKESGSDWEGWPRCCHYINSYFEVPVTVRYVNRIMFGRFFVQTLVHLMIRGLFFTAIKKAAYLSSRNSTFKTRNSKFLLDLRIENCEHTTLRGIIIAELKRMKKEEIFPVLTSLTHSYTNYTNRSHRKHDYGRSRSKCLMRLLGEMNNLQDITVKSMTLSELQNEYDRTDQ